MPRDRAVEKWRRDRPTQTVFLGGLSRYIEENDVSFFYVFVLCILYFYCFCLLCCKAVVILILIILTISLSSVL